MVKLTKIVFGGKWVKVLLILVLLGRYNKFKTFFDSGTLQFLLVTETRFEFHNKYLRISK